MIQPTFKTAGKIRLQIEELQRGLYLVIENDHRVQGLPASQSEVAAIQAASSEDELRQLLLNLSQKPLQVPA